MRCFPICRSAAASSAAGHTICCGKVSSSCAHAFDGPNPLFFPFKNLKITNSLFRNRFCRAQTAHGKQGLLVKAGGQGIAPNSLGFIDYGLFLVTAQQPQHVQGFELAPDGAIGLGDVSAHVDSAAAGIAGKVQQDIEPQLRDTVGGAAQGQPQRGLAVHTEG